MTQQIRFSIHKTIGIQVDSSTLGCYVTLDGELMDVITPLNPEYHTEIQPGRLRLLVKSMNEQEELMLSVSIDTWHLNSEGLQWLPLLADIQHDYLEHTQPSYEGRQICLHLNPPAEISVIQETSPTIETVASPAKSIEVEKSALLISKYKGLYEDLETDLETCKLILKQVSESKELYASMLEDERNKAQSARKTMANRIQKLLVQATQQKEQILRLSKVETLKNSKIAQLQLKIEDLEFETNEQKTEIESLRENLQDSQTQKTELVDSLARLSDDWYSMAESEAVKKIQELSRQNLALKASCGNIQDLLRDKERLIQVNPDLREDYLNLQTSVESLQSSNVKLRQKVNVLKREKDSLKRTIQAEEKLIATISQDQQMIRDYLKRYRLEHKISLFKLQDSIFMMNDSRVYVDIKKGVLRCKYERQFYCMQELVQILLRPKYDENVDLKLCLKSSFDMNVSGLASSRSSCSQAPRERNLTGRGRKSKKIPFR